MSVTAAAGVTATFLGFAGWVGQNPPVQARVGDLWRDDSTNPPTFKKCTNVSPLTFISIEGTGASANVPIQFQEEGGNLGGAGSVDTVNFTGAGVTATRLGNAVTVDVPAGAVPVNTNRDEIVVTFDGGGSVLPVGPTEAYYTVPANATITGWYLTGSPSGSLVVDVWKAAGTIPTNANTITGTEKPTLTAQQLNSDTSLSTWTTAVTVGDVFSFEVESAASVTRATLTIAMVRT